MEVHSTIFSRSYKQAVGRVGSSMLMIPALFCLVTICIHLVPVNCVVYTDGDIAVSLNSSGPGNASCFVFNTSVSTNPSYLLKDIDSSEIVETDTATARRLRDECFSNSTNSDESSNGTYSHLEHSRIHKRNIFTIFRGFFRGIYPGTKWCGKGNIAKHESDIGVFRQTDMCCRQHDGCPHYVLAKETAYGVFNDSPYTMSSCSCDTTFRSCLSRIDSYTSRMVGDIFFKILKMKCLPTFKIQAATSNIVESRSTYKKRDEDESKSKQKSFSRWFWGLFKS